jgi:DNA-binding CsgD family transcriptional regulator
MKPQRGELLKTNAGAQPEWRRLYELLADTVRAESVDAGFDHLVDTIESIVPADRGVAVMRMDGVIPFCIRWPAYAAPLVPRFNAFHNTHSPVYFHPPTGPLPPVDWNRYDRTTYHNEFNRPLHLRHSMGVGIRDATTRTQYALFIHRGPSGPAFSESESKVFAALWQPLSSVFSLISVGERRFRSAITEREAQPGCGVLSPREAEIADLLCRRLTMDAIAGRLGISPRTVERHAFHVYEKLNVSGKRELVRLCARRPDGVQSNSREM